MMLIILCTIDVNSQKQNNSRIAREYEGNRFHHRYFYVHTSIIYISGNYDKC
jgi:hypothetical protein